MKYIFLLMVFFNISSVSGAQAHPYAEYFNEVYISRTGSDTQVRLEKQISALDTKIKKGSVESSYSLDKERSPVRINDFGRYSFVFREKPGDSSPADSQSDSIMKGSGIDPAMLSDSMPSQSISLYKMEASKGKRKIMITSMDLASKKNSQSESWSLSFKKISDGFYEIFLNRPLSKGEYAFTITNEEGKNDQTVFFAFGVD